MPPIRFQDVVPESVDSQVPETEVYAAVTRVFRNPVAEI